MARHRWDNKLSKEVQTVQCVKCGLYNNLEMQKNQIERDKYLCGFYPKQFIEWLIYKSIYVTPHNITLHKFWNGTINEYQVVFRENTGVIWEDRTLDQIFEYWLNNIKK
jgi:hypothetical protein